MINKSNLWFLTLSSIILVLAVYYVSIPDTENNKFFSHKYEGNEVLTNIEESEILTAMRVTKEEEHLSDIKRLQNILLDSTKSTQEKNDAYEDLKYLNNEKSIEEKIEGIINNKFNVSSFVDIKDNNIKVTIVNKEKSYSLANDIIVLVNNELKNNYYVTVKFN